MTTSFEPMISRLFQVAENAVGDSGRVIPTNAFRYDSVSAKDAALVAQDVNVRPLFELDDIILSNSNAYSEHYSNTIYDFEIRFNAIYSVRSDLPDWSKRVLLARIKDDVHRIRRALSNPDILDLFEGTETGVISGCFEFRNAGAIRWISKGEKVSLANQQIIFSGKIALDFA